MPTDDWLDPLFLVPYGSLFLQLSWHKHSCCNVYPLVNIQKAIENGHRNSGISHEKWWFSIAMLNYQRVTVGWLADFFVKLIWRKVQDVLWKIFRFPAHSTPIAFLGIRVLPRVLSYWSPLCLTCFEILSESKFGFQSKGNFLQENAAL
jgi:hypothetical protein